MRTLIVAPNWIGDAVMAQPLLARIRALDPGGTIDVLAPPQVAPVFAAMAETAQVIEAANQHGKLQWRARWQLAREIRALRYDRCFVLPNSAKSALIPFLAGIAQRIGHHGEARYWLLNRRLPPARASGRPMVEFYADLADFGQRHEPGAATGAANPQPAANPLPAASSSQAADPLLMRQPQRERAARERHGLPTDAPLILLCPGAEYGPAKRWPTRHFAALASLAAFEWPEACIALIGSPKERALATEIAALSGQAVHNLCGETSLADALALIAGAQAVVSNDSGMMHVAAAYRRPQVAVFGSSDPGHTPPRSPRAQIEWLKLDCSPCFERTCPFGHTNCLNQLAPARVFESLSKAMRLETERPSR